MWADTYIKCTSLSDLSVGGSYIIADVSGSTASAMGALTDGKTKRGTIVSLSASGDVITVGLSDEPYVFELGGTSDGYTLLISGSTDYMSYDSGTGVKLVTTTTDDKAKWTITKNDTYGLLVYNKSATDRVFLRNGTSAISAYSKTNLGKSGYYGTVLYKKVVPATVTSAGYATIYSDKALNFDGTGLTAYRAVVAGDNVSFVEVTSAPAETGLLLKGDAGDYNIPTTSSPASVTSAMEGTLTETTVPAGTFVLFNKGGNVAFYKTTAASFTVGANTAWLPADISAHDFIGLDGETTNIASVAKSLKADNVEYYNLAGQRVAQPTKGLYIVNGKKVIIK